MGKMRFGVGTCALAIGCLVAGAAFAEEKSAKELWDVFGSFGRAQGQAVRDGDVWRLKGDGYVLRRMARFLNRKSQRRYRLKVADTYYGETQSLRHVLAQMG